MRYISAEYSNMSFRFSVSDVIVLGRLARKLYVICKDGSETFQNLSLEVFSLHAVLKDFGDNISRQALQLSQNVGLERVAEGCHAVLKTSNIS